MRLPGSTRAIGFSLALIAALLTPLRASAAEQRDYILATATTGGTFYPVGVALATLTKVKLKPKRHISLSAISSAGSGENLKLMREGQAQFAILQGLYGAWAWDGSGRMEASGPQQYLRSVSMLWQNVEHFVIDADRVKTGDMSDLIGLEGEKFSIGKRNSGTEGSGRHILAGLGIDPGRFDLVYLGYGPSADALLNGGIEGMNIPAGPPVGAVTRAFAARGAGLRILDFNDRQVRQANGDYRLWTRYTIPAGTYPNQQMPAHTIAQPNFLAVRDDVDEEAVYLITKAIYEHLPFLHNIHKATKRMDLAKAIDGLPVPLHPGAARYYREQGLTIPAHLTRP